jgi:hypothetical protein
MASVRRPAGYPESHRVSTSRPLDGVELLRASGGRVARAALMACSLGSSDWPATSAMTCA